ncbi:MAG: hypothetical protein JRG81_00305 [Deltaproteobacteria bacterium]|nr:hypothetical protein [Deltaproteobacteria bacterium]
MGIQALEKIKELIPAEDYNALSGIVGKDVIFLGENEAFALKDNEGEIRAFKQRVTLSHKEGTLIQPVKGGPFVISAQGYEVWAEAAGACVIFPKEVLVGGQWQPNPHVERDETNRRILAVHARAVAFRFSSKGIPQVSDWSTIFDTPSYRMIDLLAKAKSTPQAFRLLPTGDNPDGKGTWAAYPFDESITLWINTSHDEALKWFSQILNREKKALDFAQTFAKRNALKHLSGLQKAQSNVWTLSVLCWRPTSGNIIKWDATQYIKLQDKVGSLITGNGDDFAPNVKQIESQSGQERVSDEEGFEGIEKEIDPEDQEPAETKKDEPETNKTNAVSSEEQKVIKNYEVARDSFPDEYAAATKKLGLIGKTLAIEDMNAIYKRVTDRLNEQAV